MKKRWIVLLTAGVVLLGGVVFVWRIFYPPVPKRDYRAELHALIEAEAPMAPEIAAANERLVLAFAAIDRIDLAHDGPYVRKPDLVAIRFEPPEHEIEGAAAERLAGEAAFEDYMSHRVYAAADHLRTVAGAREPLDVDAPHLGKRRHPYAADMVRYAVYEAARMHRAWRSGRPEEAADAFENLQAMCRYVLRNPFGFLPSYALRLEAMATKEAQRACAAGVLPPETCRRMLGAIDEHRARLPGIRFIIEAKFLTALDRLAACHDGRDTYENLAHRILASHGVTYETINELKQPLFDALGLPPAQWEVAHREYNNSLEGLSMIWLDAAGWMAPAVGGYVAVYEQAALEREGLRLMLALELHRHEHGGYPESLDALTPKHLEALPEDRFAPDGRFRYRLLEKGHGLPVKTPYVLYSVGYDGEDDGCAIAEEPHEALRRGHAAGTDYVLNLDWDALERE